MPNNPFDSFHDMVAEAKAEREQLDRLLTISTPRERLLVAAIGLLLAVLVGWLFLGSVARTVTLNAVLVEGEKTVQALARAESDVVPHIKAGMPAVIELRAAPGTQTRFNGTVAAIAVEPSWHGLSATAHRVDVSFDADPETAAKVGALCWITIELGRQPPTALFGMGRS
ncbi:MAG: hypothetical protein OXP11_14290 [Gammaproteobacteria bacterium]|nr:hypothetical protein [Gammaproteobacteria bacterium]